MKLEREIKRQGIPFKYYRVPKNQFGEPDFDADPEFLKEITGMYHEFTAHMTDTVVVLTGTIDATTRTKKSPQSLCRYDDILFQNKSGEQDHIQIGDIVEYNHRIMQVSGLQNIMEWNMIVDVSFEEVDDGTDSYIRRKQKSGEVELNSYASAISSYTSGLYGNESTGVGAVHEV
jgi:hypothetical protein